MTPTAVQPTTPTTPQPTIYGRDPSTARFSVAQYQRMIELGILTAKDKVELLENYIVYKIPGDEPPPLSPQPVTYGRDPSIMRFSVAQYQRMIEAGILTTEDKVELLENYVVLKMTRNAPHDGTIDLLMAALFPVVPQGWRLRVQQALILKDAEPEPDFAVVRGNPRSYLTRQPQAADCAMVIEVAHSSILRDQRDKTRLYARAGIPTYWIVNLVDNRIEVYTLPSGPTALPAYGAFQTLAPGDVIPVVLDGVTVATVPVADLLP
jgi:Uma2 family endonuclease